MLKLFSKLKTISGVEKEPDFSLFPTDNFYK